MFLLLRLIDNHVVIYSFKEIDQKFYIFGGKRGNNVMV